MPSAAIDFLMVVLLPANLYEYHAAAHTHCSDYRFYSRRNRD